MAGYHRVFVFMIVCFLAACSYAQTPAVGAPDKPPLPLFRSTAPLTLQLKYSNRELKKQTNDSTFMASMIWFRENEGPWDSLQTDLRARGNFRRENCYFAPLKLKLKKATTKQTIFEGVRKIKLVLPCLLEKNMGDFVLKEYLAYKLYEQLAPYHFKTRLARIVFQEARGNRLTEHHLWGFLVEDMDDLAERCEGREIERVIHPLQHDAIASIQNAFFEYMIANTDFSTKQQHNQKLLFADTRIIPIPYDFDMSGLVNAPYADVTNVQNLSGTITHVTDRIYKGYEREEAQLQAVRKSFIEKKAKLLEEVASLEELFEDKNSFKEAQRFIISFFDIFEDDKKFSKNILNRLRGR